MIKTVKSTEWNDDGKAEKTTETTEDVLAAGPRAWFAISMNVLWAAVVCYCVTRMVIGK